MQTCHGQGEPMEIATLGRKHTSGRRLTRFTDVCNAVFGMIFRPSLLNTNQKGNETAVMMARNTIQEAMATFENNHVVHEGENNINYTLKAIEVEEESSSDADDQNEPTEKPTPSKKTEDHQRNEGLLNMQKICQTTLKRMDNINCTTNERHPDSNDLK